MVTSLPLFPIPICLYDYGEDSHELNIQLVTDILSESNRDPRGKQNSNINNMNAAAPTLIMRLFILLFIILLMLIST